MTGWPRNPMLATIFLLFHFSTSLHSQRPSQRYQAAIEAGNNELRIRAFVTSCLGTRTNPKPMRLYSQGAWFVTPDLAAHMKGQPSDDGTAQVWSLDAKPRAVSLWIHDDEFDRSTLACLDGHGKVIRQVNEYMPGMSEPDLHWIHIHTFTLTANHQYRTSSRYTDWNRHPIPPPKLNSEDRDFITGERRYTGWRDFDFSSAYDRTHQQTKD